MALESQLVPGPRPTLLAVRVFVSLTPLLLFFWMAVLMAFRGFWPEGLVFLLLGALWLVTLIWRRRSGITTWTLTGTVSALITGVRPTRDGLVPGAGPRPQAHEPGGNPK